MRATPVPLLLLVACAGSAPSPATASASDAAPATAPASGSATAASPDASPRPRDEREIAFASAFATYRSRDRAVYQDLSEAQAQQIADCFDTTVPLEQRAPVVYYIHVFVPNPDHDRDSEQGGFGFGGGGAGGISYPELGTYPAFEACAIAAIPEYGAPADVAWVELRLHIYTDAQAVGSIGHGSP